jgi:hypothetical protein
MRRIKPNVFFLLFLLLLTDVCSKAQSINGDTIYVDARAEIAVRFPSMPSFFYTVPSDAPYNLKTLGTGFTIIAKKKNTATATLVVTEGKRTHHFYIAYKKNIDYNNLKETDYDYSTTKKLKDHVKLLENKERYYNEAIKAADRFFQNEDLENAKIFYNQARDYLDKPWPNEQIKKINKQLKKKKRKNN